jgi:hypothetical protein
MPNGVHVADIHQVIPVEHPTFGGITEEVLLTDEAIGLDHPSDDA